MVKLMYKTIIKIKRSTPLAKLEMINAIIRGLFNNRAGKIKNSSHNPYVRIFKGVDPQWDCLNLGTLALEDVSGLLGYISACWWIDEDPAESCDVLKVFATPVQ